MLVTAVDAGQLAGWYRRNRRRSDALFDLIDPSAYYSRPIALRNPIVFYEGHLPAFSVIAFLRRGLGHPPIDPRLEKLFERGIDPDSIDAAVPRSGASTIWPSRDAVRAFGRACDAAMLAAIEAFTPTPESVEGLYTALEHEAMHQETLLYMWHRLPYQQKRRPVSDDSRSRSDERSSSRTSPPPAPVRVPAGVAVLGADRADATFGWDNEFERHTVQVRGFDVDPLPVTNADYLEFMNDGGYSRLDVWSDEGRDWIQQDRVSHPAFWLPADASAVGPRPSDAGRLASSDAEQSSAFAQWRWRGMFDAVALPAQSPVYVSHAEASAYARWKGRRLMTEAEWHRAAEGATAGFADFAGFDPIAVAARPEAASLYGVHDLIGNGWEWTSTVFAPFKGFTPMRSYPEYSADFFDGRHYVMKGASPATARELVRPSFRNWFRGNYPYVYAKFRTVSA
jgi:formylglycine-generating enzyme required for sulfatase activity